MKTSTLEWILFAGLLAAIPNANADFAKGVSAYHEGDFAMAAVEFLIAAEKGDARAQLNLRLLYDRGLGLEQDPTEAAKWYGRAADNGNLIAQTNLAAMYFQGLGVEQSDELAASWYHQAARAGHAIAQYNLAVLYEEGIGIEADPVQAYAWMEAAIANGAQVGQEERAALLAKLSDEQQQTARDLIDTYLDDSSDQENTN